jgi:hypothetical protein
MPWETGKGEEDLRVGKVKGEDVFMKRSFFLLAEVNSNLEALKIFETLAQLRTC